MKKYNIISLIIATVLFTTFTACNSNKDEHKHEEGEEEVIPEDIVELRADQIALAKIDTGLITLHSLSGILKVSGTVGVAPQSFATVCMPMGGFVKSTTLMPGNAVTKGQTLAILENQDFIDIQQNFLDAKNKLEYAEAEYKRHTELFNDNVYSQKNVQQITSEYKSLKSQVKALEQKLTLIGINPSKLNSENISSSVSITSPISGYVKTVNVNIGKFVSATDVLFEIINSDKLFLELTLFEKDADKVSIGQNINFIINNETEQHKAQVYQTGKSVNTDRVYKVYANVVGACKNILPGMYVNATIEASSNKVTAVPNEAIVSFDDKDYIFIFEQNKTENGNAMTEYRMIPVGKGVSDGTFTEIILPNGFDIAKAKVVIKGAYNLLSAKKNAGEMSCG